MAGVGFGDMRHPRQPAARRGTGFSLVELLVVIGIIALLLGLLLPALSGFRQRAREVHCQATLRNIGFAGQLHANDHRGRLPLGGWQFNPVGGVVNPAGVGDADEKYYMYYTDAGIRRPVPITASLASVLGVKFRLDSRANLEADLQRDGVRNLFRCWSQEPQGHAGSMGDGMGWGPPSEWSSYIFNEALLARRNQPWEFPQGHMSKIRRPGAVMFAMDANPRDFLMVFDMTRNYTMWDFHNLVSDQPKQYGPEPIDFVRHRYRGNVLFCDWHVESLPLTENGLKAIGVSNGIYD